MMTSILSFCGSLGRQVKQYLKQWSKPVTATLVTGALSDLTRSRADLIAENAMLRQQLIVLKRQVKLPGHRPGLLGAPPRQLRRAAPLSSAASQRCLKTIHIPPRP